MVQLTQRHRQRANSEHLFKVLVIGEAGTGKTSFVKRYVHDYFSRAYRTTLGVDFALKMLLFNESTVVRLQLWDVAGQERFGAMTRIYYKDAHGAFLMFDLSDSKTFNSVMRWKADLDSKVRLANGENIPCLLVANKCDLAEQSDTDEETLRNFAKQNGFIDCLYTSSKANINIERAAELLVAHMMRARERDGQQVKSRQLDTIRLTAANRSPQANERGANKGAKQHSCPC